MVRRLSQDRSLVVAFTAACLLHGLLLTVPEVRQAVVETVSSLTVSVRLKTPAPTFPEPEPITQTIEIPPLEPPQPAELADLPEPEPTPPEAQPPAPAISANRILLEMQDKRRSDPLAALREEDRERPDFYARSRPNLEQVLNPPSLQLPFEDTRIYLVDSYDPGLGGSVQRFFDDVTMPFGFTTKNNTRIQCAWILVIAGCSWGDVSHYYASKKAKKRKPNLQ